MAAARVESCRLQISFAGLGDAGCQVSSSGVAAPPFDASAFSEEFVAGHRSALFLWRRPALEASHLYEAAGFQRDKTWSADLGYLLPR